ncbi:unnamed protein product [Zymoseptoria tritici ST99CH_1A5]|uniref:Uncharacterized protein n=1 Tax=Zymoseptoria tritici ST99CH_1A5 TaxID=1276529 RepID=A0A1Y6LBW7_ZYMTR|nr:unnamed protein product [Zymoseptoria tritici ST99CH_1A5]
MSSKDSIARCAHQDFNQHGGHVLHFEYSIALIGDNKPALEPPLHVQHRTRPPADRTTFGLISTRFYAVLSSGVTLLPRFYHVALDNLVNAIMNLRDTPGKSTLEFAAFFDEARGERRHRCRLTTWYQQGQASTVYFVIGEDSWKYLMEHAGAHRWINTMQHLEQRASDRAVYHIREELDRCYPSTDIVEAEEGSWNVRWATKMRTNVLEVLCSRLHPFQPPFGYPGVGDLHVMLPCGHAQSMWEDTLHNLRVDQCKAVKCPTCKQRTLQPEDEIELAISTEVLTTQEEYLREHHHWSRIRELSTNDDLHLPGTAIAVALDLSLESFKAPTFVNPNEFSLAEHKPTEEVMDHFSAMFFGSSHVVSKSQEDLVDMLMSEALNLPVRERGQKLSESFLPPGYVNFLLLWIGRAVIFLAERRCRRVGSAHAGVHRHGDDLVYNSDVFGQANAVGADSASVQLLTDLDSTAIDFEAVRDALAKLQLPATATVADMMKELEKMQLNKQ